MESYDPKRTSVLQGIQPLYELYGKFPEMLEVMCMIRNVYGDDFMEIFERSFQNIEQEFVEESGKLKKKDEQQKEVASFVERM